MDNAWRQLVRIRLWECFTKSHTSQSLVWYPGFDFIGKCNHRERTIQLFPMLMIWLIAEKNIFTEENLAFISSLSSLSAMYFRPDSGVRATIDYRVNFSPFIATRSKKQVNLAFYVYGEAKVRLVTRYFIKQPRNDYYEKVPFLRIVNGRQLLHQ